MSPQIVPIIDFTDFTNYTDDSTCVVKANYSILNVFLSGGVSEWFKEPVLKTGVSYGHRGFESLPLRHFVRQCKTSVPFFIFSLCFFGNPLF